MRITPKIKTRKTVAIRLYFRLACVLAGTKAGYLSLARPPEHLLLAQLSNPVLGEGHFLDR